MKPRTPQLNGKVERSHRTDKDEFYQLLTYRDDVDLEKSWPSGSTSTILIARTELTAVKRHTRRYGGTYPNE
jgi:transposase InsO family protein